MVNSYIDQEDVQIRPALYVEKIDDLTPWLAEPDLLKNVKQEKKDEFALAIFSLAGASLVIYMLWDNQEIILLEQEYGHDVNLEMLIVAEIILAMFLVFVILKTFLEQKSRAKFALLRGLIFFWVIRIMWVFSLFYSRTSRAVAEFFSFVSLVILIWIFLQIDNLRDHIFLFFLIFVWQIYWIYYTFLISSHPWILAREEELPNIF